MNESLVRSPSTRTAAAHTAMRMSQRRASVEVVDGAAWIVKDRRIHQVMAHSATLRRTGISSREAAVVTSGRRGSSGPFHARSSTVVDASVEIPREALENEGADVGDSSSPTQSVGED